LTNPIAGDTIDSLYKEERLMPETILARLRKERNMTQAQLAEKSGVHIKSIARLEIGDRPLSNLRLSTALALADALQVDPHLFLSE
jgi:transcriptional regulator with XRE-family HTH domain